MSLNLHPIFADMCLQPRRLVRPAAATVLLLLQAACGGGGNASSAPVTAQMRVLAEPPGAHCGTGGVRLDLGSDVDGNGQLEATEAQSTAYACPSAGTDTVLASMSTASACPSGAALRAGVDANGDGVLQNAEVSVTACVDTPPAAPRLAKLSSIAPANTCPFGGRVLTLGVDSNGNGVLDGSEITSSTLLCPQDSATPLTWADAGNAAVQAVPNTGYRALGDTDITVVTLPQNLVVGDVVAVSGASAAGWRIAQNAGQSINAQSLGLVAGQTWAAREQVRPWLSVSSSADGRRLFASTYPGRLYTSDDAGLSWTPRETDRAWDWGASSADGMQLVISDDSGQIHLSTDAGATWTVHGPAGNWIQAASSPDGQRLVVAGYGERIQLSTDGGLHWQATGEVRGWYTAAMSSNGQTLWAAANGAGSTAEYVYASTDGGSTWAPRSPPSTSWVDVAMSPDGNTVVAAEYPGSVYLSVNGGATWSPTSLPQGHWWTVAVSTDGRTLLTGDDGGRLYTSHDGGMSWTSGGPSASWQRVAMSDDGTRMAAVAYNGRIYTSSTWTTVGPTGSLAGGAADAVLLQYAGNGNFVVLRHTGTVTAH